MQHLIYRPDVDGLRALAIIPVVLYHAGIAGLSGGFVGVDLFFVISGYLITSILLREQAAGQFRFREFWLRRARRILPAMFAVVTATLVAGWWLLAPDDYVDLGRSARYQALFAANLHFWQSSGYFETAAELKPLLHMWSLAVEEQFYLIFPLLLIVLCRWRTITVAVGLALLALLSLAISALWLASDPAAAFYLLPARAWELLAGSALAWVVFRGYARPSLALAQSASLLGLALLVFAVVTYDESTRFPGVMAVPPVLAGVLLIWANQQPTWMARLLSTRLLVAVGLISYSLYLWHWPLFAFSNYYALEPTPVAMRWMLVAVSVLLAWLSWRWIETPFRKRQLLAQDRRVWLVAGCSIVLLFAVGQAIRKQEGFPERLPEDARRYALDREWTEQQHRCIRQSSQTILAGDGCRVQGSDGPFTPRLLAWGDSHNGALLPGLELMAQRHGVDLLYVARSACSVVAEAGDPAEAECLTLNQQLLPFLEQQGITQLLLVGRWSQPLYGEEDAAEGQGGFLSEAQFAARFSRLAERLQQAGVTIWVLREVPLQTFDPPVRLTLLSLQGGDVAAQGRPLTDHRQRQQAIDGLFDRLASDHFRPLDPIPYLCPDTLCRAAAQGHSLYRDDDHLSVFGARFIAPVLTPLFREVAQDSAEMAES